MYQGPLFHPCHGGLTGVRYSHMCLYGGKRRPYVLLADWTQLWKQVIGPDGLQKKINIQRTTTSHMTHPEDTNSFHHIQVKRRFYFIYNLLADLEITMKTISLFDDISERPHFHVFE